MDTNCYSDLFESFWRECARCSFENSFTENDYWWWREVIADIELK